MEWFLGGSRSAHGRSSCGTALVSVMVAACFAAGPLFAGGPPAVASPGERDTWSGAWQTSPSGPSYPPAADQSYRAIVRMSMPGRGVRITLSNQYGNAPVTFRSASIAPRAAGAAIRAELGQAITFGGGREVTVAPGSSVVSDPADIEFGYGTDLAVSFFVPTVGALTTGGGIAAFDISSYSSLPAAGDRTSDTDGSAFPVVTPFRSFLTRVDAADPGTRGTVVAFGDSITEGTLSGLDNHADYPDRLADRIHDAGLPLSIVNAGIAGNTVLPCHTVEATKEVVGEAAVTRFARDALAVPNIKTVIINEGGNDLRYCNRTAGEVETGLRQLIDAAHAAGVKVLLGTYLPRVSRTVMLPDAVPDTFGDDQRQILNDWIRTQRDVTVVDFDRALADPSDKHQKPGTETLDGIHPGPAGYAMMADTVPLDALLP